MYFLVANSNSIPITEPVIKQYFILYYYLIQLYSPEENFQSFSLLKKIIITTAACIKSK